MSLPGKSCIPERITRESPHVSRLLGIGLLAELADAVDSKSIVLPPESPEIPAFSDESASRLPSACPDRLSDADLLDVLSALPALPPRIQRLILALVVQVRSMHDTRNELQSRPLL